MKTGRRHIWRLLLNIRSDKTTLASTIPDSGGYSLLLSTGLRRHSKHCLVVTERQAAFGPTPASNGPPAGLGLVEAPQFGGA